MRLDVEMLDIFCIKTRDVLIFVVLPNPLFKICPNPNTESWPECSILAGERTSVWSGRTKQREICSQEQTWSSIRTQAKKSVSVCVSVCQGRRCKNGSQAHSGVQMVLRNNRPAKRSQASPLQELHVRVIQVGSGACYRHITSHTHTHTLKSFCTDVHQARVMAHGGR